MVLRTFIMIILAIIVTVAYAKSFTPLCNFADVVLWLFCLPLTKFQQFDIANRVVSLVLGGLYTHTYNDATDNII